MDDVNAKKEQRMNGIKYDRGSFLKIMALSMTVAALPISLLAAKENPKPNIILNIADDVSAEDVGCYGSPGIQTPVMDQLAAEGVRFDNGFVSAA